MSDLANRQCQPCRGTTPPLSAPQSRQLLQELHADWQLRADGREIQRLFQFKNYFRTIAFVNAVAWIAHQEDHHPDLEVSYNTCLVRYSTHALQGLSENDFISAAKVDQLVHENFA